MFCKGGGGRGGGHEGKENKRQKDKREKSKKDEEGSKDEEDNKDEKENQKGKSKKKRTKKEKEINLPKSIMIAPGVIMKNPYHYQNYVKLYLLCHLARAQYLSKLSNSKFLVSLVLSRLHYEDIQELDKISNSYKIYKNQQSNAGNDADNVAQNDSFK